jgi:tetratricopeptide (TPR) repeat protein
LSSGRSVQASPGVPVIPAPHQILNALLVALCVAGGSATAQAPAAPGAGPGSVRSVDAAALVARAEDQLRREDPLGARASFRALREIEPEGVAAWVGLGRVELLLGRPEVALGYADRALDLDESDDAATALRIRALIRARRFQDAVTYSARASSQPRSGVEVLAAHASALFRTQQNDDARACYEQVVAREPLHAEAHLRLGSGLLPPSNAVVSPALARAIRTLRAGQLVAARDDLVGVLRAEPHHPIAHRLLGETLYRLRAEDCLASKSAAFRRVREQSRGPDPDLAVVAAFVPGFDALPPARAEAVLRALGLFGSRLPTLVRKGGSHELLAEEIRTTDSPARASLRGRRTFDGRVWDDVRGIGGLRAATGIEALDEAATFGFDTLAHEVAHQVHLHGFERRSIGVRIRAAFDRAIEEGRCLDYYAASNYAEYFGQGVEAFHCLVKRPSAEATHGHTRFELLRVDPALHDLIAELVDFDPLARGREGREELLATCVEAALAVGRVEDALTAVEMLATGPVRAALEERTRALARTLDVD